MLRPKVAAVANMEEPTTVKEPRRFLGMINQLSNTLFFILYRPLDENSGEISDT